jgi:hypothetical protein
MERLVFTPPGGLESRSGDAVSRRYDIGKWGLSSAVREDSGAVDYGSRPGCWKMGVTWCKIVFGDCRNMCEVPRARNPQSF